MLENMLELEELPAAEKRRHPVLDAISNTRADLMLILVFTALLGLLSWVLINEPVFLYIFYLPVVVAAMKFPRREALEIGLFAALLVVVYVFFVPERQGAEGMTDHLWFQLAVWGGILVITSYVVATLRTRVAQSATSLDRAYEGVLAVLSRLLQTVNADTEAHGARVSAWAVRIGREMGLDRQRTEELRIAGLLHDVAQVDASVELLRRAAALAKKEELQVRDAGRGADMPRSLGGMMENIAEAVETYREKFNGSGDRHLLGEAIPLLGRILAVADAYDAMASDRAHGTGTMIKSLSHIEGRAGLQFDPKVVAILQDLVKSDSRRPVADPVTSAPAGA